MPGRTDKPIQLPTVLHTDVFRATPAIFEEMLTIYSTHTHADLTASITCVTTLVKEAQDRIRTLLERQVGAIRSLDVRRDGGSDATTFTEEDDDVASELAIPVAVENIKPNTAMKYRVAVVVKNAEDADITILKIKRRFVEDQDKGDD